MDLSSRLIVVTTIVLIAGIDITLCKRTSKLPSDIHLCKKDDPQMDTCLLTLFETVRPKLITGIPEIGLPPMDPLILPEVIIFKGGQGQMKAIGREVKITGISNAKITFLKTNIDKLEVNMSAIFPFIKFEGQYDVDARFAQIPVKGKGPMRGNATEVSAQAFLKGKFIEIEGEQYVEFHEAIVNVDVKAYRVRVEKLFPDKQLNDAINVLLNDRKLQTMVSAKPIVNRVAAEIMLEMVNGITKNLPFDEVFAD